MRLWLTLFKQQHISGCVSVNLLAWQCCGPRTGLTMEGTAWKEIVIWGPVQGWMTRLAWNWGGGGGRPAQRQGPCGGATGSDGPSGSAPRLACKMSLLKVAFIPLSTLGSLLKSSGHSRCTLICAHTEHLIQSKSQRSVCGSLLTTVRLSPSPCSIRPVLSGLLESTSVPGNKIKGISHRFKGWYPARCKWERRCSPLRLRKRSLFLQVTHSGTAPTFLALPTVQQAQWEHSQ